jgi:hypothetical protein
MQLQPSEPAAEEFSFWNMSHRPALAKASRRDLPCYMIHTTDETSQVVRANLDKSPMYSGVIKGIGTRYCPSFEDKVVRYPQHPYHLLFLEPEGADTGEYYLNGFSSSLPPEVQIQMVRTLPGMKNAVLKIEVEKPQTLNQSAGEVEFLFNANKTLTNQFRGLNKVASGGELSRLMLALKAIHLEKDNMPTLIFDEIDSGISGEIASKVALIMKNMAENRQIIAITHLPQIAAKANYQFKVYKSDIENQTESKITLLSKEERVIEIAKMLSDENPSEAALTNSRELLS